MDSRKFRGLKRILTNNLSRYSLSFFIGTLLTLSFAPINGYWLAPLLLACLIGLWQNTVTPRQAFYCGLAFGLGFFGTGIPWVYISLKQFGGMAAPLAALAVGGLIFILALFPAAQGCLFKYLFNHHRTLVFASLWVLLEWIRSHLFTGFPWLLLGYTATSNPWLKGYAPLIGVFGLSFIIACIAGLIYTLLSSFFSVNQKRVRLLSGGLPIVLLLIIGNIALQLKPWTHSTNSSVPIALLQGNIQRGDKWNSEKKRTILTTYEKLLKDNLTDHSLIIMPEAAIPVFPGNVSHYLHRLDQQVKQKNSGLIVGIPLTDQKFTHYYNGMLALGHAQGRYCKRRLVPFGEYIPLAHYLTRWVNRLIAIPMSSLTAGPTQQTLIKAVGIKIAPFICYEIAYPDMVLNAQRDSQLLLVLTDDSWFGASWAAAQHLQIAQMRALESGRFLLFSSNNGITAVINPRGEVVKQLPRFKRASLVSTIYPMAGNTPLIYWGSQLILLLTLILLGISLVRRPSSCL